MSTNSSKTVVNMLNEQIDEELAKLVASQKADPEHPERSQLQITLEGPSSTMLPGEKIEAPSKPLKARLINLNLDPATNGIIQVEQPVSVDLTLELDLVLKLATEILAKARLFKDATYNVNAPTRIIPQNGVEHPELPFINLSLLASGGIGDFSLVTVPKQDVQGVPGLLGELNGDLRTDPAEKVTKPITGLVKTPLNIPLRVDVEWSIREDEKPTSKVVDAGQYHMTGDLTSPEISIVLRPETYELTADGKPLDSIKPVTRYLHAQVTFSAGARKASLPLPPVPLPTAVLGLPTMLALFENENFTGSCLVMVPGDSPLPGLSPMLETLAPLQAALSTLEPFAELASFAVGLGHLASALSRTPVIRFRKTNSLSNLDKVTLIYKSALADDLEAEDQISSLILFGSIGAKAACYNKRNFQPDEGWFTLELKGEPYALIPSLHEAYPPALPDASALEVKVRADNVNRKTFGDEMSAVMFPWKIKGGWYVRVCEAKTAADGVKIWVVPGGHDFNPNDEPLVTWDRKTSTDNELKLDSKFNNGAIHIKAQAIPEGKNVSMCVFFSEHVTKHMEFDKDEDHNIDTGDTDDGCEC